MTAPSAAGRPRGRDRFPSRGAIRVVGTFREWWAMQGRAAKRVGGAWTAAVLDADTDAETPWIATQGVPGPDLHAVVAEQHGPLPEHSVRALGNRLALALQGIHEAPRPRSSPTASSRRAAPEAPPP
ncbi:hypothetical protein GCM10017752_63930 [Streptomyces roseoviridis]